MEFLLTLQYGIRKWNNTLSTRLYSQTWSETGEWDRLAYITLHIRNIFKEGELDENSVCKESLLTATDGCSLTNGLMGSLQLYIPQISIRKSYSPSLGWKRWVQMSCFLVSTIIYLRKSTAFLYYPNKKLTKCIKGDSNPGAASFFSASMHTALTVIIFKS